MTFSSKGLTSRQDREHKTAEQERLEAALEEGLKGTFPASYPSHWARAIVPTDRSRVSIRE